jgi:hypothetical protein
VPNLAKFENTQRVERADMEFVGDTVPRNMGAALPSQFLTNPAGQAAWIMSGFAVSNPALKQCRVDRGVALLQTKENGAVERGMLAYEGAAFINLDLAAYANGTYSVYIRFELVDGDFQNRIFWTGAAEGPSNIATKRVAGWGMRVELVSPGSEWFKIGEVVVSGSPTLTVTNKRFFYFEGEEANATPYAKSWGGGTDRNSNRAVNGVKDLQTFVQAVQVQLESLMGGSQRWWETPAVPLSGKVTKAGDTMSGNLLASATGLNLGSPGARWDAFLQDIDFSGESVGPRYRAALSSGTTFAGQSDAMFVAINHDVNTATQTVLPAFMGLHLDAADFDADGWALWSQRTTADAVTLFLTDVDDGIPVPGNGFAWDFTAQQLTPTTASTWKIGTTSARFAEAHLGFLSLSSAPAFSASATNQLHASNIPKLWANVSSAGAGVINDGFNVSATVSVNTTRVRVTPVGTINSSACIVVSSMGGSVTPRWCTALANVSGSVITSIDISFYSTAGALVDPSGTTCVASVAVFGVQ